MSDGGRSTYRLGTRGSQLALWQARTVAQRVQEAHAGVACEIVVIKTSGDRLGEAPLSEAGGKRLFVREIEEALLDGRVDLAVHSAKDMPVDAVDGLSIAAVLPREEPWDAIVLPAGKPSVSVPAALTAGASATASASDAPNATSVVIGTSSVRRVSQLRRVLPSATFAPIRGNLDTRLRKLDAGQYDLLVLAAAGLKRLGAADRISARLPLDACVPAPGQGAIAVEIRADDDPLRALVSAIDDRQSAQALSAERALVEALGGGCQTPVGALALPIADDRLELHAVVISLDSQHALRASSAAPASHAVDLGRRVAADLLARGAAAILS